uniref:cDNA FLJ25612 fis, clone STM01228 n=1 Tax=Homo sapiens TaxID=9606 RepID=Q8N1H3_HUMAN|nr:unnamed protein product [Homo sapiens]
MNAIARSYILGAWGSQSSLDEGPGRCRMCVCVVGGGWLQRGRADVGGAWGGDVPPALVEGVVWAPPCLRPAGTKPCGHPQLPSSCLYSSKRDSLALSPSFLSLSPEGEAGRVFLGRAALSLGSCLFLALLQLLSMTGRDGGVRVGWGGHLGPGPGGPTDPMCVRLGVGTH